MRKFEKEAKFEKIYSGDVNQYGLRDRIDFEGIYLFKIKNIKKIQHFIKKGTF